MIKESIQIKAGKKAAGIRRPKLIAVGLTLTAALGAASYFFGTTAYSAVINVIAVGSLSHSEVLDGPATVTVRTISFAPGEVGVWHYHPGPLFNVVTQGTVTLEDANCGPDRSFSAGQAFNEGGRIHRPKNGGSEPTFAYQTFVTPEDMPMTIELPNFVPLCQNLGRKEGAE